MMDNTYDVDVTCKNTERYTSAVHKTRALVVDREGPHVKLGSRQTAVRYGTTALGKANQKLRAVQNEGDVENRTV